MKSIGTSIPAQVSSHLNFLDNRQLFNNSIERDTVNSNRTTQIRCA